MPSATRAYFRDTYVARVFERNIRAWNDARERSGIQNLQSLAIHAKGVAKLNRDAWRKRSLATRTAEGVARLADSLL